MPILAALSVLLWCAQPCPSHTPKLTFTCSYAFAVSPANGSRTLWIHRDMCRFHGDETGVAVMGSIARVCAGDFVEVAVSIYSGGGRVALDRVSWLPLRQEKRRQSLPSKGFFSPEACPLEWSTPEWFPADEFRLMSTERVKDPGRDCRSSPSTSSSRQQMARFSLRRSDHSVGCGCDAGRQAAEVVCVLVSTGAGSVKRGFLSSFLGCFKRPPVPFWPPAELFNRLRLWEKLIVTLHRLNSDNQREAHHLRGQLYLSMDDADTCVSRDFLLWTCRGFRTVLASFQDGILGHGCCYTQIHLSSCCSRCGDLRCGESENSLGQHPFFLGVRFWSCFWYLRGVGSPCLLHVGVRIPAV